MEKNIIKEGVKPKFFDTYHKQKNQILTLECYKLITQIKKQYCTHFNV